VLESGHLLFEHHQYMYNGTTEIACLVFMVWRCWSSTGGSALDKAVGLYDELGERIVERCATGGAIDGTMQLVEMQQRLVVARSGSVHKQ
jgi:hypothetical protein